LIPLLVACGASTPTTCPTRWYLDRDGDGFGDPQTGVQACDAGADWVANGEDCDDREPGSNPLGVDACDDGVDGDCDGWDPWCADRIDEGDATLVYAANGASMGSVLAASATAEKFAVVVPGEDQILVASTLFVGLRFLDLEASIIVTGSDPVGALSFVGDVDRDGEDDLLVGMPEDSAVALVRGPFPVGSVQVLSTLPTLVGTAGSAAGHAVAGGVDVDGDAFSDLVIGAPLAATGGLVFIYTGRTDDTFSLASAPYQIVGDEPADEAGGALLFPVDFDGDGLEDLGVGAPGAGDGRGAVALFTAPYRPQVALSDADLVLRGDVEGASLGATLAGGDVDGDGALDLVVGAPGASAAYVFADALRGTSVPTGSIKAGSPSDGLGAAVAVQPLGEGGAHVVVGAPFADNGVDAEIGVALVWRGPHEGAVGADDVFAVWGASPQDYAGAALAVARDVTGDGNAELLIGAPGFEVTFGDSGGVALVFGRD
jgi:hypothetical protein